MRIAFDAKRAYHNHRGLGNYSRDVIRLLTAYAPENEYLLYARPTDRYTFPYTQTVAPEGLWSCLPSLWRSFGCIRRMKDVDVYWGLSGELPFGIHRTGVKTIVTVHDVIFLRYPELYSVTYRWLFTRKMRYALRVADVIIAISEQTKRDIVSYFGIDEQRIQVVYQGCSNRFREPFPASRLAEVRSKYRLPERFILTVGAIEPRKNLKHLIEAMHMANIDLPLVAVGGKSAYAAQMADLAKARKVDLRLLHTVPFDDLPAVYKAAELFCYPSIFEGFGIPILESMCIGTPVLTSTGSCFAETGGDAAAYADPMNPQEIADRLTEIVNSPELRQSMTEKGYRQAERFTDERVAANLLRAVPSV
jgi:glycosyltransferase involved in cell wall biosynthesis